MQNSKSETGSQTLTTQKVERLTHINRRLAVFMVIILLSAVLFLAGATARLVRQLTNLASPLVYSSESYPPLNTRICAGEPLRFVITSTVQDAPTRVSIYSAIWSIDTRRTVRSDSGPTSNLIFMRNDIGRVITSTVIFSDTAGLPLGRYEFRRLAQALDRAPQVYAVPFTVKECQ